MREIRPEDALDYHSRDRRGKIEVVPTKPLLTQRDLLACGAADFELAATALEEMFRIHAAGDFAASPSSFLKRPERPHVADRFIGLAAHLGGSFDIWIDGDFRVFGGCWLLGSFLDETLDLSDGVALRCCLMGELGLEVEGRDAEKSACMTHGESKLGEE